MGFISLEQSGNLYWLGRYAERVYLTLRYMDRLCDELIDHDKSAYKRYCEDLNIPDVYNGELDFIYRYLFDAGNPDSVYSNLSRAYDNALVLRSCIKSRTLAYIQMPLDLMEKGAKMNACALLNQQIVDYLLAFWGSVDETVGSSTERCLLKAGRYMERLDMQLRLQAKWSEIEITLGKLERRLEGARVAYNEEAMRRLINYTRLASDDHQIRRDALQVAHTLIQS